MITGDFNSLCRPTDFLEEECGFSQLVHHSTHGNNLLDKVSPIVLICFIQLCTSLLKTKHKAVVVADANYAEHFNVSSRHVAVNVYDHRAHNIDELRWAITSFDWSPVLCNTEISNMLLRML